MLELNTTHPKFSMAMELLCLVQETGSRLEPLCVSYADVKEDLGLHHQTELTALVKELGAGVLLLIVFNRDGRRFIRAGHGYRGMARQRAQEYFRDVYADQLRAICAESERRTAVRGPGIGPRTAQSLETPEANARVCRPVAVSVCAESSFPGR